MAFNLKSLKSSRSSRPPSVLIHAVKGKGKSSLAAEFPNPIYLGTMGEATPQDIDLPSAGPIIAWPQLLEVMAGLADEEHDFKTLIIDTVDGLEPLVWAETCERNKWNTIEDAGYGKGYLAADYVWKQLIDCCDVLRDERGMMIVFVAHSEISSHEEPGAQPYKRYDVKLHRRAEQMIGNWCDFIFFLNTKIEIVKTDGGFNKTHAHAEGGGARWLYTDSRPAFVAKNRSSQMPAAILYKRGEGFTAIEKFLYPTLEH